MFQQALTDVLARLETARAQGLIEAFALIGGFAVSAWGVPRATQDINFAIAIGPANPHALGTFLGGRFESGEPEGVLHTSIRVGSVSVPLQLILFPSSLTEITFRRIESLSVMDQIVPVVSWQVLVLLKLYAGGPQDTLDAYHILQARHPQPDELDQIREMAESLGILNEWGIFLNLHQQHTSDF